MCGVDPLCKRTLRYESLIETNEDCQHCHTFTFMLSSAEWVRVKHGFLRSRGIVIVENNESMLHIRIEPIGVVF